MSIGKGTQAGDRLKTLIERWANLLDQIDGLKDDLKDLKGEVKNEGFNVRALEKLVAMQRKDGAADKEVELLNDLVIYAHAAGMPLDLMGPIEDEPDASAAA